MKSEIPCRTLLEEEGYRLELELVGGDVGLDNPLRSPRIQKPGLALAGYADQIKPYRVQILGKTELSYLQTLEPQERRGPVQKIFALDVACFVVTNGQQIPDYFIEEAQASGTPLFVTPLRSSLFIERIERALEQRLARSTHLHGVLVDVMGVGILIRGASGVGKSECAMDLVLRGHRLVADDVVEVRLIPPFKLLGRGAGLIRYHMEIRGLGILNIQDLFGITAIRAEKEVELVVDLVSWTEGLEIDRLGFEEERYPILEVEVPYLRIPVAPGRNIASVVEVAARNHLLKAMGHNSAIRLKEQLEEKLKEGES